jgi:hypothetical protein
MTTEYPFFGQRHDNRVLAASARLLAAAEKKRKKRHGRSAYYGDGEPGPEGFLAAFEGGHVTRNHYGCVVLNASNTLFIDVDMGDSDQPPAARGIVWDDSWQRTLDDLRAVLSSELDEGFRIYRTAAGFRILATAHEFDPASVTASQLMDSVGADDDFMKLCRIQNNFRARLTPKPWRCGSRRPPNRFPRHTAEEQSQFDQWLAQYERACRDRATCRFLEHVGPAVAHGRIAPIIELHDRETKAFEDFELA